MAEDDPSETARAVNPDLPWRQLFAQFANRLLDLLEGLIATSGPPAIVKDGLYTRQQVLKNLRVGAHTLDRWCAAGLRKWSEGSRQEYFLGEHLLAFMSEERQLPPAYESPHAERNRRRKRKP